MLVNNVLVPGIVVPLVATALALFLLELLQRRWESPWRGAASVAVAAGFMAVFVAVSGWPRWVPVEATQRLFFLVAGASVATWLVARASSRWVLLAVEAATIALLLALVLESQLLHVWSTAAAIVWLAGLWITILAATRVVGSGFARGDRGLGPFSRLAVFGGTAVILGLSDSFRLAQLAGGLTCAMAAVDFVVWRGRARWDDSDALVVTTSLAGLMLSGYFYAGLGSWSAALLGLAMLSLASARSGSRWVQLIPLVPLLIALGLSIAAFVSTEDPYDDYYATLGKAGLGTATIKTR